MTKRATVKIKNKSARQKPMRKTLFDQAYSVLKTRILENQLPAGFQATEQELSENLGMSRTPVREAIIRLANERLVQIRPRHGMRVLPVSADDMVEIYQVLNALESAAAAIVATKGLSESQLRQMQQAVDDMELALENDDRRAWASADQIFHKLLVDFSGNSRLVEMVKAVRDQSTRVRLLTLNMRPKPTSSNRDHANLLKAIVARDPERASRVHREHLDINNRLLVNLLRESGFKQL